MPTTRFFRVAVEGATTDGREIQRQWLLDAAQTYNRETYTARVNMEHIRGYSPEAPFNAYGDIVALKTEEVTLSIGGKDVKRLALFAQVDALDSLVELNRQRQKLFSSIEINPNFAGTGKAYLVGLAVTDNPASLGTEMLAFAAQQGENSPLAHRKQDAANLFTAAIEAQIELEGTPPTAADPTGLFASLKTFLDRFTTAPAITEPEPPAPPANVQEEAPNADLAAFAQALGTMGQAFDAAQARTAEQIEALTASVTQLTKAAETTPATQFTRREPATGGAENAVRTDC